VNLTCIDACAGFFFAVENAGRTGVRKHFRINGAFLDNASARRQISMQHFKRSNRRKRIFSRAAHLTIGRFCAMLKVVVERPHARERRVIKLASAIELVHNNGNTANVI